MDAEIQIDNYTLFRSDRAGRSHGGVAINIRNYLAATTILKDSNSYCDSLVIEIHKLNLILINIYRPPKCPKILFNQTLQTIKVLLENIESENSTKDIFMLGDFNFPFLRWTNKTDNNSFNDDTDIRNEEKQQAKRLLEFAESFFLDQYIKKSY